MRKITQIAVSSVPDSADVLYALCDDGSLWSKISGDEWVPHELVPQPEKEYHPRPPALPVSHW